MSKTLTVVKELIREQLDPVVLLEYYGVDIPDRNYRYNKVRCACPLHGGDNPTGMSFDLNSKMFTCFTSHCGEDPKDWWFVPKDEPAPRDVFLFIKLMEEAKARENGQRNYTCPFPKVIEIASKLSGVPVNSSTSAYDKEMMDKLDNQRWMRSMAKLQVDVELEVLSEDDIELYKAQLPLCEDYLNTRNFDDTTLEFFEIGFSPEGIDEPLKHKRRDVAGRIVFPIRDENGSLVGWSGRLATDDKLLQKRDNKWMHKLDFDKGFVLYNYNNAKPYIEGTGELIIVEGPFDVMRLWSYGIYNVVAVMGSSLTPEQLQLAVSSAFKMYVFLDGDGAGKSGARRICEQLVRYGNVYLVEADGDPDDLSLEEAYDAISNAKRYIPEKRTI
jgi:5S rRNA maturation endonuclease (ribonuclease M5)